MIRRYLMFCGDSAGKPRASGDDPGAKLARLTGDEVNPARAGMIPGAVIAAVKEGGKPRASGDDPTITL